MGLLHNTAPPLQTGRLLLSLEDSFADPCSRFLERALTSTGADHAKLAMVEGESVFLHATAGRIVPEVESGGGVELNLIRTCVQTGCFLRSDDAEMDPRVDAAECRALGIRSIIILPVRADERVVAVLALYAGSRSAFSLEHVGMLQNVAAQLREVLVPDGAVARQRTSSRLRPATPEPPRSPSSPPQTAPGKILRFVRSERLLHWSIAIPFTVCFVTALVLVLVYNPHPQRPFRFVFSAIHRFSGICLALLPLIMLVAHPREHKTHIHNIRQAWIWVRDDFKWLLLMGPAALSSRITLPDQGKFNAAEKLNFMMVMSSFPLFVTTGVWLFLPGLHFLPWVVHVGLALLSTPLMLGHIFMATVNPSTRVGLGGMFSGYVDRHWAKHHYGRWYRENFEAAGRPLTRP